MISLIFKSEYYGNPRIANFVYCRKTRLSAKQRLNALFYILKIITIAQIMFQLSDQNVRASNVHSSAYR